MLPALFAKGVFIGLSVAAPIGPIGALCIRRSLLQGRRIGVASGLGVATADALYGAIAALGVTTVAYFLIHWERPLSILGGAFLAYLGLRLLQRPPVMNATENVARMSARVAFVSIFFLTLSNPATILLFMAVFAGLGLSAVTHIRTCAAATVLGIFLGSAAWWIFLTTVLHVLHKKIPPKGLLWVNTVAGVGIFLFGLCAIVKGIL